MKKKIIIIFIMVFVTCVTLKSNDFIKEAKAKENLQQDYATIDGMFIVPTLAQNYTQKQFDYMFASAKEIGIQKFIVQYSTEYYSDDYSVNYYENGFLDKVMNSARKYDIDIYFGTQIADDLWFEKYDEIDFLQQQEEISQTIVTDVYNKYFKAYSDVFKGYYLTFEINNIDFTGNIMNNMIEYYYEPLTTKIHSLNPELDIMISPLTYFPDYNTSEELQQALVSWNKSLYDILDQTYINIIAPQDCLGNGIATLDEIELWFKSMQKPFQEYNKVHEDKYFWANNENYDMNGSEYMDLSIFINNMNSLKNYTSNTISFSTSRLLPTKEDDFNNKYYNGYKYYYETGTINETIENVDGIDVVVDDQQNMLNFTMTNNLGDNSFTKYSLYADSKLISEQVYENQVSISTLKRPGTTYTLKVKDCWGNSVVLEEFTVDNIDGNLTEIPYSISGNISENAIDVLSDGNIGGVTEWTNDLIWNKIPNTGTSELDISLGDTQNVDSIDLYMLQDRNVGIYLPDSIQVLYEQGGQYIPLDDISLDTYAYNEATVYKLHIKIGENTSKIKLILKCDNLNKNLFITELDVLV